ncbi:MAG: hypothetical protein LBP26_08020 [Clostridiales bacterium]|jgi:hypothetical protein|nr:hypothetical protein [Clostridiales bacterium]
MVENESGCGELKKRAMLAKQRMRMGYWKSMDEEKQTALNRLGLGFMAERTVRDMQRAKFERDVNRTMGSAKALLDEELYQKVRAMLDEDEDVTNPIGRLVDKDAYEGMDEPNRQKYILELSKKFRQMRERYYAERPEKFARFTS